MKDINWSWVAGFFQAEGTPTGSHPRWKIQFYQHDLESMQLLQAFFVAELKDHHSAIYTETFTSKTFPNGKTYNWPKGKLSCRLNINGKYAYPIIKNIFPLLRGSKRTQTEVWAAKAKLELPQLLAPLDFDFVIGFWEGDGSPTLDSYSQHIDFDFTQKDAEVLLDIRDLLNTGALMQSANTNALRVYSTQERIDLWLSNIRLPWRHQQLESTIARLEALRGERTL